MVEKFKEYLTHSNMAKNTVSAYIYAVNDYNSRHKELTKKNLLLYKAYLIETFKPKTVNLRVQALNKYLEYLHKPRMRLKSVKVQQRTYLENVISNADYIFLKNKLQKENNQEWYCSFILCHCYICLYHVRCLACLTVTGSLIGCEGTYFVCLLPQKEPFRASFLTCLMIIV